MSEKPIDEMSFEEAMAALEAVVGALEQGEVGLEDSIALYERGAALKAACEDKLKAAEEKVARITLGEGGAPSGHRTFRAPVTPMSVPGLAETAAAVQARLQAAIADLPASAIRDAMGYAVDGGKGLRGFLVVESARIHGLSGPGALQAAAAIEALHAYSLVHDDLPAMDDDDLRRGRPTVHVKWDEAVAVLVGDALQTLAFGLLADPGTSDDPAIRADLVASLARASGASGMVLGQAQDMAAETAAAALTLGQIEALQAGKTGALICWSAEAGAVLSGSDVAPMRAYAAALGLAFQIADDILDVTGDPLKAGKRLQKDAEAGKATFVSLMGLDGARMRAKSLSEAACDALAPYGAEADALRALAGFVISREH